MIDALKKTLLTGIGAAVVTTDKVQASLEDLVRQGKITAAEARATAEKIAREGRQEFETASEAVHDRISDLLKSHDKGAHARIDALEARIQELEKALKAQTHSETGDAPKSTPS